MSREATRANEGVATITTGSALAYALVTPARNEAQFIELTLQSVVAQAHKPVRWVIVSDGSTDGTDEIVRRYAERFDWIELVRMPERAERHFAGKAHAFGAGFARLAGVEFDVIGNLDADMSFDAGHFAFLMGKFAADPSLGVASTAFTEDGLPKYDFRFASVEHVSGACQMFRRECFEQIGGYKPIALGGIDLTAVLTARMLGWRTRTFMDRTMTHHRSMGTAQRGPVGVALRGGHGDYRLGTHPLWELARCLRQVASPRCYLGVARLSGYFWAWLTHAPRVVPRELVDFRRKEQLARLSGLGVGLAIKTRLPVQSVAWIYLVKNYYVNTGQQLLLSQAVPPCEFLAITSLNAARVTEFREPARVAQYLAKLRRGERGYFAERSGTIVGSIWATVNSGSRARAARGSMRLRPGDALIHDIVTAQAHRGTGIAPFMVSHLVRALFSELGAAKVLIDVNVRNRASLRVMQKLGIQPAETAVTLSLFRVPICIWRGALPPERPAAVGVPRRVSPRVQEDSRGLVARPIPIQWTPDLPIFSSSRFLAAVGDEYGWLGGFDPSGQLRCFLPYTIIKRPGFRIARFRTATIPLGDAIQADEEIAFLNSVSRYLRDGGCDLIIPPSTNSIFNAFPDGAEAVPYGTLINDLDVPEDRLFSRVHPGHRNNIRRAIRDGVVVKEGPEFLDAAYDMIVATVKRSGLGFHSRRTVHRMMEALGQNVKILVAEHGGRMQGCLIAPFSLYSAHSLFAGSADRSQRGAAHLIHWEAMRRFRAIGVQRFDFTGVRIGPAAGTKQAGILEFKSLFGGRLISGFVWRQGLRALRLPVYRLAVHFARGGDVIDQERKRHSAGDALSV